MNQQPQARVTVMSTPDVVALKLFQLECALKHKRGDDLTNYIGRWLDTTRVVMTERFGPLRDFGPQFSQIENSAPEKNK